MGPNGLEDITLSANFGVQATVVLFFPLAFTGGLHEGILRCDRRTEKLLGAECRGDRSERGQSFRPGSMGQEGRIFPSSW